MKIVTSDKRDKRDGVTFRVMSDHLRTIILTLLLSYALPVLNAQIEKNELKLTPEMEKMVVTEIQNMPEKDYSEYGITDRLHLRNLHLGKPVPKYRIVNEKLKDISINNVPDRLSDGEPFSLQFTNEWIVPVMADEAPLLFRNMMFSEFGGNYTHSGTKNIAEHFRNYEYKDSIIGSVAISHSTFGMDDLLIIRKENQDIFVQIYDEATGEYFKNEYRFSELLNLLKDLNLRAKEAQMRYYAQVANKSELKITPEITEMLDTTLFSRLKEKDWSDESLSELGIKNRAQLEHLHLGKPIPMYRIVDENLTFSGYWNVPVMSDGEPLFMATVKLEDNGQYSKAGFGGASMAKLIHNYEHKDLIIGSLEVISIIGMDYLIIKKENKDIFVQKYDFATREYLKNEYSFSEVLNLLKK